MGPTGRMGSRATHGIHIIHPERIAAPYGPLPANGTTFLALNHCLMPAGPFHPEQLRGAAPPSLLLCTWRRARNAHTDELDLPVAVGLPSCFLRMVILRGLVSNCCTLTASRPICRRLEH